MSPRVSGPPRVAPSTLIVPLRRPGVRRRASSVDFPAPLVQPGRRSPARGSRACSRDSPATAKPLPQSTGLQRRGHATLRTSASRSVVEIRARMLSSSSPRASRLRATARAHAAAPRGAAAKGRQGAGDEGPRPGRAATSPSRSRSRYAFATVFGLIARSATTSRTVGSWSPRRARRGEAPP